jgi:hypothetical protein
MAIANVKAEISEPAATQMDQLETDEKMSQVDESVVNFHMEDEPQWVGVNEETKTELDATERLARPSRQLAKQQITRNARKCFCVTRNFEALLEAFPLFLEWPSKAPLFATSS